MLDRHDRLSCAPRSMAASRSHHCIRWQAEFDRLRDYLAAAGHPHGAAPVATPWTCRPRTCAAHPVPTTAAAAAGGKQHPARARAQGGRRGSVDRERTPRGRHAGASRFADTGVGRASGSMRTSNGKGFRHGPGARAPRHACMASDAQFELRLRARRRRRRARARSCACPWPSERRHGPPHRRPGRRRTPAGPKPCRPSWPALWPELQVVANVGDGAIGRPCRRCTVQARCAAVLDIRMPGHERAGGGASSPGRRMAGARTHPSRRWCSSPPTTSTRVQAFEAQAVDYVLKPVQLCRGWLKTVRAAPQGPAGRTPGHAVAGPGRDHAVAGADTLGQLRSLLGAVHPAGSAPAQVAPSWTVIQASVGNLVHLVPVDEVLYFEAADQVPAGGDGQP